MTLSFINLTNGIEAFDEYGLNLENVRFIRLQSSYCERHLFDELFMESGHDLLMNLAIGNKCIIYDYSANSEVSKAVYMGLEWIKFVLNRRWFNTETKAIAKGKDITAYFDSHYQKLSKSSKKKADYFKKFLQTKSIMLEAICRETTHDNDIDYYKKIIRKKSRGEKIG